LPKNPIRCLLECEVCLLEYEVCLLEYEVCLLEYEVCLLERPFLTPIRCLIRCPPQ
jgi:hypothetical protein